MAARTYWAAASKVTTTTAAAHAPSSASKSSRRNGGQCPPDGRDWTTRNLRAMQSRRQAERSCQWARRARASAERTWMTGQREQNPEGYVRHDGAAWNCAPPGVKLGPPGAAETTRAWHQGQ
ncbi:hypothetical protein Purlil1_5065 [Purpureocillium lilacinum]|uniref:Uncharacterized protein n=2 Tax=Purpureocillium lilacinum TaxID=33203 RepID=A0ABR0C3U8_PURLI|nr:hypothetical protein Purlil1_5065 [Purpureocillium lilacinum]